MHKQENEFIKIQLDGPFRVVSGRGHDLTPVSQKAQGLLALLAYERSHRRSRIWLQDKLWSEQDRSAGSTNLRQCLATVRKSLGQLKDILGANRVAVWLDPGRVVVEINRDSNAFSGEFLEGMDIPDDEFNSWVQSIRLSQISPNRSSAGQTQATLEMKTWRIVLHGERQSGSLLFHLEAEVLAILARNLREYGDIETLWETPEDADPYTLEISLRAVPIAEAEISIRATVSRSQNGHILWADTIRGSSDQHSALANFDLLGLAYRAQAAAMREIRTEYNANGQTNHQRFLLEPIISKVFSFRADMVATARTMLDGDYSSSISGTVLGWRSQTAIIELIERFHPDEQLCIEQGIEYAARAVEIDPMNSMVLATASNANILLNWNIDAGLELSEMALKVNPTNPLAWISSALAAVYSGEPEKGFRAAKVASKLSAQTNLQFWCEFHVGLALLMQGHVNEARRAFETSSALAPDFRPPLRYLLAINASMGDPEKASAIYRRLKRLEPDLSLERFIQDESYPISLARKADLMSPKNFSPLL